MKIIKVLCRDAQIGKISTGMTNTSSSNGIVWDQKGGNITVDGKMYTFTMNRDKKKNKKFGLNGGHILTLKLSSHWKDKEQKDYFDYGFQKDKVSVPDDFPENESLKAKWFIKPSTPEAKAAFDALVQKFN